MRSLQSKTVPIMIALATLVAAAQAPAVQGPGGQGVGPHVADGVVRTDVNTIRALTMEYSIKAAQAALDACAANDPRVAVVVVDSAGNQRLIMVADGARASLAENARRKGLTAASLHQVTSVEQEMVAANPLMIIPPNAQFLIEPGGVPIRAGTLVIGAIGVEGGDPMEAERCAQTGVDSLKDDLHPEAPVQAGTQPESVK
jgi:uncharacterized protein GlcG (DUF336 family)